MPTTRRKSRRRCAASPRRARSGRKKPKTPEHERGEGRDGRRERDAGEPQDRPQHRREQEEHQAEDHLGGQERADGAVHDRQVGAHPAQPPAALGRQHLEAISQPGHHAADAAGDPLLHLELGDRPGLIDREPESMRAIIVATPGLRAQPDADQQVDAPSPARAPKKIAQIIRAPDRC